jgi:hypothetical protein
MKLVYRILVTVIAFTFFICSVKISVAQYPGMAAFRASQTMQFANQQMQMQMMAMVGMRGASNTSLEYPFQVLMRDSSRIQITSAIYNDTSKKKSYLLIVEKKFKKTDTNRFRRIYPSQTLSIDQSTEVLTNKPNQIQYAYHNFGKPTDSCWMFKVKAGAITAYSYSCEDWNDYYSPSTVVGIQVRDEPIVQFNAENLKKMIESDLEAMKYFDKKKYFKAIDRYNKDSRKAEKR